MNPPFRQGCRIARMLVLALGPAAMPFGLHSQPTRTARVSGRVTDRSTGGPIALAPLLVIQEGRLFTTDSAGPHAVNELTPRRAPPRARAAPLHTIARGLHVPPRWYL